MGIYLNNMAPYENFGRISRDTYFVDKTSLLRELIQVLSGEQPYICITRPRRFGKTVMANMIAAFFGKAVDSSDIFNKLEIAQSDGYQRHLNRHDVIYIDFSDMPRENDSYKNIFRELRKA